MGVQAINQNHVYEAQSTALTSDGNSAINTVKVVGSMKGESVLTMTFQNTTNADILSIPIMPGSFRCGPAAKLPVGVTGTVTGFESFEAAVSYFTFNSTQVRGLDMTTSDTDNFDNTLLFTKMKPNGQKTEVPRSLDGYRAYMGDGKFNPRMVLPADEFTFLIEQRQRIEIAKLAKMSTLTIKFKVFGMEDVVELVPFEAVNL